MTEPLLDEVRQIVADVLNIPPDTVSREFSRDMCAAWDSMQHLSVVLAVEETFGSEFSAQEIEQMTSVDAIARLVQKKTKSDAKK